MPPHGVVLFRHGTNGLKILMTEDSRRYFHYLANLKADADIPRWSGYMPDKVIHPATRKTFYDLPKAVRPLMIADGTVTMALEALFAEPITVRADEQLVTTLTTPVPLLELAGNETVVFREVSLLGNLSGRRYVRAFSLVCIDRLPEEVKRQLLEKHAGMGVILRNAASGSFREVLHIGGGDLTGPTANRAHRTYRVSIERSPSILITEVFDLSYFQ